MALLTKWLPSLWKPAPSPGAPGAKAKGQLSRRQSSSWTCWSNATAQAGAIQQLRIGALSASQERVRDRTQDGEQELTLAVAVEAHILALWPGFQTWGGGSCSPFKPDGPQPHPAETESQSRRTVPPTRSAEAPWTASALLASSP